MAQFDPIKEGATPVFDPLSEGAIPVGDASGQGIQSPQQSELLSSLGKGTIDAVEGIGSGALSTVYHSGDLIRRMLGMNRIIDKPEVQAAMKAPNSTVGMVGKGLEQTAEFILAGGPEKALAGGLATKMPKALANIIAGGVSTGAVNKLQGGDFGTGALLGAAGTGLGEAANAVAPSVAEAALGIAKKARVHGKTPGIAVLDEISGIRPTTIKANAQKQIDSLMGLLESAASVSPGTATVKSATNLIDKEMTKAVSKNSLETAQKLTAIKDRLTVDAFTGIPFPTDRTATEILNAKRGIGELVKTWTKDERNSYQGLLERVYGELDSKLDSLVPISKTINQRISSLIPVKSRAAAETAKASLPQRMFARATAHTGAMVLPLAGMSYGYKEGGWPGAFAGAAGAAAIQEGVASPHFQMALARALHSNSGIPTTAAKGLVLQLLRGEDNQ